MNSTIRRTLKISLRVILSLTLLVFLVIGTVFYLILTPERLKPIVTGIASEMIDGELDFKKVELTIISTFPNISAELSGGFLRDTSGNPDLMNDTIVSFDKALVVVDVVDLIKSKITINRVELINPSIYAYISEDKKANWDVFKIPIDTTTVDNSQDTSKLRIALKRIDIVNAKMRYDDRSMLTHAWLNSLNFTLRGEVKADSRLNSTFEAKDIVYWQNNYMIADNLNLSYECRAIIRSSVDELEFEKFDVKFGNIPMSLTGIWNKDSIDIRAQILPVSIEQLYKYIPEVLFKEKTKFEPKGILKVDATIKGAYAGKMPPAKVLASLENGAVRYTLYENAYTDTLHCKILTHYDFYDPSKIVVKVEDFKVSALSADIDFNGVVKDPFGRAYMNLFTETKINLTRLSSIFSLKKGTSYAGTTKFVGKLNSSLHNILKRNLTKIKLDGQMYFDTLQIYDTVRNFKLRNKSSRLSFASTEQGVTMNGKIENVTAIKIGQFAARLDSANINMKSLVQADSVESLEGTVGYNNLSLDLLQDSITVKSSASNANLSFADGFVKGRLTSDSLSFFMPKNDALLSHAILNLSAPIKKLKTVKGSMAFKKMTLNTPAFPLPISVNSTELSIGNDLVRLKDVDIHVGSSDMKINGSAQGLAGFTNGGKLKVRGLVKSNFIDVNELIYAANNMQMPEILLDTTAKTNSISNDIPILHIPSNIDANLTIELDSLRLMELHLTGTRGGIQIKNGEFIVRRIVTSLDDSKVAARAIYKSNNNNANLTLSLDAERIDVKSVRKLVPLLDTIVPIMKNTTGILNFNMASQIALKNVMIPNLNDIDAAINFSAQTIAVKEDQTLQSIAKMLMLKNKKLIQVDSLAIHMVMKKGMATFYPFRLKIDRYYLAFGGDQSLNDVMNMNYHLSVLKSPVPIKFGINITGPLDDFNINVGRTKYKYLREPEYDNYIDPQYVELRDNILKELKVSTVRK